MRGEVWMFDVDGCIVDALSGTALRPHTADLLAALGELGATVTVWSAGGAAYAERRALEHDVHHLVAAFYDKGAKDAGSRWSVAHLPPQHLPTVLVDDQPEYLPDIARIVPVRPYLGPGSFDRSFLDLLATFDTAAR